jgi:hypothetical protein
MILERVGVCAELDLVVPLIKEDHVANRILSVQAMSASTSLGWEIQDNIPSGGGVRHNSQIIAILLRRRLHLPIQTQHHNLTISPFAPYAGTGTGPRPATPWHGAM